MQIKIEIDVKPEELRRFLGLPDVAGMQEDLIKFMRDKLGTAGENFDPASFVKDSLDSFMRHPKVQRVLFGATPGDEDSPRRKRREEPASEDPSSE